MKGFDRGRNLDKLGMHAQDTAELFFTDVEVPVANLLGEEGKGFYYLMLNLAQERLGMAVGALAVCQAGARPDPRVHQGAQGVRPAGGPVPAQQVPARRAEHRGADRARCTSTAASSCTAPGQLSAEQAVGREVLDHRAAEQAWSIAACSCTVATATCSSTRSPARGPTAASRPSTAAPARSCARSSAAPSPAADPSSPAVLPCRDRAGPRWSRVASTLAD